MTVLHSVLANARGDVLYDPMGVGVGTLHTTIYTFGPDYMDVLVRVPVRSLPT